MQNSQCTVEPYTAGASPSGNTWTVNVPVTFAAGHAGAKQSYLYASSVGGASSGWQDRGDWTARAQVSAVSPTTGAVTDVVEISGAGFGHAQGSSTVTFNGTTASVEAWSDIGTGYAPTP